MTEPRSRVVTRSLWSRLWYWCLPSFVALILYWPGLTAWFQKDDFAWLGLRDHVHGWGDLPWALFAPLAQGTIRTLSERIFFLSFTSLFGLHALPFRLAVLVTGFATLALLSLVTTRLTRSRLAGFLAAILWITNSTTAFVFSWTAIYYELLCTLFFLASLWLLIRYAETGNKRFYLAQWAIYLTGFFVLELNVVYPAIALMYALCCAPGIVRKTLPLFVPAVAYAILHVATAPMQASGPYKMHWDLSVLPTLWTYWKSALGPNRLIYLGFHPSKVRSALALALMLGLLGFLAWTIGKRQWLTVLFASWFLLVLAPLLPLRDHISDYYLTIPTVGLAMWGAHAFVRGWRAALETRLLSVLLLALYLGVNIPLAHLSAQAFHDASLRIEAFLKQTVALSQPGKIILIQGAGNEIFVDALGHRALRLYGLNDVFLVPFTTARPAEFQMSDGDAQIALAQGRAILLDASADKVRDITPRPH